jgi:hypothetical protein
VNGDFTLPGFSGSVVSNLDILVNDYNVLKEMIRSSYNNKLADLLKVEMALPCSCYRILRTTGVECGPSVPYAR